VEVTTHPNDPQSPSAIILLGGTQASPTATIIKDCARSPSQTQRSKMGIS